MVDTDTTFSLDKNLFFSEKVTGVVFFINGFSNSILKGKDHKNVFVFDSRGNDTINETKKSILIELAVKDLSKFIICTYGQGCYQLAYVFTEKTEDKFGIEKSLNKFKRTKLYLDLCANSIEKQTRIKETRKRHYNEHINEHRIKKSLYYDQNLEK